MPRLWSFATKDKRQKTKDKPAGRVLVFFFLSPVAMLQFRNTSRVPGTALPLAPKPDYFRQGSETQKAYSLAATQLQTWSRQQMTTVLNENYCSSLFQYLSDLRSSISVRRKVFPKKPYFYSFKAILPYRVNFGRSLWCNHNCDIRTDPPML